MNLCIYHGGCTDGVAAAWIVNQYAPSPRGWWFHPGVYQEEPPLDVVRKADRVLFVDFSYKLEPMRAVIDACPGPVDIIDHHRSAIEALEPLTEAGAWGPDTVLDESRCGAWLTWTQLEQTASLVGPPPELLRYIDARDRWVTEGAPEDLDQVIIALRSFAHSPPTTNPLHGAATHETVIWDHEVLFALWSGLMHPDGLEQLRRDGDAIWRYYEQRVTDGERGVATWTVQVMHDALVRRDYRLHLSNTSYAFASDVGARLLGSNPPPGSVAGCWWADARGYISFSLRSGDGTARKVAELFGGGGHPDAAGFKLPAGSVDFHTRTLKVSG